MVCLYTGFADVLLEMKKNPTRSCCTRPAAPRRPRRSPAAGDLGFGTRRAHFRQLRRGAHSDQPQQAQAGRAHAAHEHCCSRTAFISARCGISPARALAARARAQRFPSPRAAAPAGAVGSPATPWPPYEQSRIDHRRLSAWARPRRRSSRSGAGVRRLFRKIDSKRKSRAGVRRGPRAAGRRGAGRRLPQGRQCSAREMGAHRRARQQRGDDEVVATRISKAFRRRHPWRSSASTWSGRSR